MSKSSVSNIVAPDLKKIQKSEKEYEKPQKSRI